MRISKQILARIAWFFGVGRERRAVQLITRFLFRPKECLSDAGTDERELLAIVILMLRVLLAPKLYDVVLHGRGAGSTEGIILALLFIFAKQVGWAWLWSEAKGLNWFVRKIAGKDDFPAALRAYAYSFVLPNPLLYAYTLGMAFRGILPPAISFFVIYGLCGVAWAILAAVSVGRAYRLTVWQTAVVSVPPTLIITTLVFQLPFLLSDRFSDPIVRPGARLELLRMTEFPRDTAMDGSGFLKNALVELAEGDSARLDSSRHFDVPRGKELERRVAAHRKELEPFVRATWFSKRGMDVTAPQWPIPESLATLDVRYSIRLNQYLNILDAHFEARLEAGDHGTAMSTIDGVLKVCEAIGRSDLGLVFSIIAAIHPRYVASRIDSGLESIASPLVLGQYAALLRAHPIETEWVLNSLRQEFIQSEYMWQDVAEKVGQNWVMLEEEAGFQIPGYSRRKLLDLEDTKRIGEHMSARVIAYAMLPDTVGEMADSPEVKVLKRCGRFNRLGLLLGKNTLGRMMLVVPPVYPMYVHSTADNQRYMEFVYTALLAKKSMLETGRRHVDLKSIIPNPGELEYLETFRLERGELISEDPKRFKQSFKIALPNPPFNCKEALDFEYLIPKGRVQDKEYNPNVFADSVMVHRDKCVPYLIANLDNPDEKPSALPYMEKVTVGDVCLHFLSSLFNHPDRKTYSIPEMDITQLRRESERSGRKAIKKMISNIWKQNKENVIYDSNLNCLTIISGR